MQPRSTGHIVLAVCLPKFVLGNCTHAFGCYKDECWNQKGANEADGNGEGKCASGGGTITLDVKNGKLAL